MAEHTTNPQAADVAPIDIPAYARAPLVVERLARLHGVAQLLKTISAASDRDEALETLAHVVETEAGALEHALELMGAHEQLCPDRRPFSDQEKGGAHV